MPKNAALFCYEVTRSEKRCNKDIQKCEAVQRLRATKQNRQSSWPGEAFACVQDRVPQNSCFCSLGFVLIGSDVKLNSPSSLVGQALTDILQHPERARDALRVLLHLVRRIREHQALCCLRPLECPGSASCVPRQLNPSPPS